MKALFSAVLCVARPFLKVHFPSSVSPPSSRKCAPKTVSHSATALRPNLPPHSASSHYRLSPELKSCRWLSCAKIQTPPEQFPASSHLNAAENLLRSLIYTDFFLFSARQSKLATQPVQAQWVSAAFVSKLFPQ